MAPTSYPNMAQYKQDMRARLPPQKYGYDNGSAYGHNEMTVAVAVISGALSSNSNKDVKGTIFLSEIYPCVVLVSGVVTGIGNGKHGLAIFEYGDITHGCQSAGEHYNPTGERHGNINGQPSHVGDLGNIVADKHTGVAFVNKISQRFSIESVASPRSSSHCSSYPIVGRAIGVMSDPDDLGSVGDFRSAKNGNSGNILACGIIGYANTKGSVSAINAH